MEINGIKLINTIKASTVSVWHEQINQWKDIANQLGNDFYNGMAYVNPKHAKTCLWCQLKPLCRINEEYVYETVG